MDAFDIYIIIKSILKKKKNLSKKIIKTKLNIIIIYLTFKELYTYIQGVEIFNVFAFLERTKRIFIIFLEDKREIACFDIYYQMKKHIYIYIININIKRWYCTNTVFCKCRENILKQTENIL